MLVAIYGTTLNNVFKLWIVIMPKQSRLQYWKIIPSSITIYDNIWLFLQFHQCNSKDIHTILYLVLIVLVSHNCITLENVAELYILFPIHLWMKHWKIVPSFIFIYDDIWLFLQFLGLNSKDNKKIHFVLVLVAINCTFFIYFLNYRSVPQTYLNPILKYCPFIHIHI